MEDDQVLAQRSQWAALAEAAPRVVAPEAIDVFGDQVRSIVRVAHHPVRERGVVVVRVHRIVRHEPAVAAADQGPRSPRTRCSKRSVVLRAPHNRAGRNVRRHAVELRNGEAVVHVRPPRADRRRRDVGRFVHPAVVPQDHRLDRGAVVVRRRNNRVIVHVRGVAHARDQPADRRERHSAVATTIQIRAADDEELIVGGIDPQRVGPRALTAEELRRSRTRQRKRLAAIRAHVDQAALRVHRGVHLVRNAPGIGQLHTSCVRQVGDRNRSPVCTAVSRVPGRGGQCRVRLGLECTGNRLARVVRVEHDLCDPLAERAAQRGCRKRCAAVGAAIDARCCRREQRGAVGRDRDAIDEIEVGIRRGAQLTPRGSAVDGLEHAGATNSAAAGQSLAGRRVHDCRVGGREHHRRHSKVGHEVVDRQPTRAAVRRLPDAAADAAGEHRVRVVGMDGDRSHAAADIAWAERRPVECAGGRESGLLFLCRTHRVHLLGRAHQGAIRNLPVLVPHAHHTPFDRLLGLGAFPACLVVQFRRVLSAWQARNGSGPEDRS